eukprot:TRINITY_DN1073_c0_g1_i1.p2 TRINITY_DN1073_c0_g1~~TRINITY_DN1073_c0_g1_i1.p2  ORF type:complete len:100 (+),score=24.76 TRINITY_DN1073_c0_g1_i1:45-344(+)
MMRRMNLAGVSRRLSPTLVVVSFAVGSVVTVGSVYAASDSVLARQPYNLSLNKNRRLIESQAEVRQEQFEDLVMSADMRKVSEASYRRSLKRFGIDDEE